MSFIHPNISPSEFLHFDKIHPELLEKIGYLRSQLQRPFYFSLVGKGVARHPNGDAVPPGSTSHAGFSLHKWGIDHVMSYVTGGIVEDEAELCKALDFDMMCESADDFAFCFEQVLTCDFGGVGVYPYWTGHKGEVAPGFHVDTRPTGHPLYGARWIRDREGKYRPLSELLPKGEYAALEESFYLDRLVGARAGEEAPGSSLEAQGATEEAATPEEVAQAELDESIEQGIAEAAEEAAIYEAEDEQESTA